jgi:hypothetical protein
MSKNEQITCTTVQIKNIEKEKIRAYSLDFSLNAVYWTA